MKSIITLLITSLAAIGMIAQNDMTYNSNTVQNSATVDAEIMPFGGYMFGGSIQLYDGEFDIKGNGNYGVTLAFPIEKILSLELSYFRMDTEAEWDPNRYSNINANTYDMSMQYFQIGATKYLSQGPIRPFTTASVGATWFDNTSGQTWDDLWAFSAVVGAGVRIEMNEHVALRIQGRFMIPMYFDGLGLSIGTGGTSAGAYFGAYALQGDFSGGLIFKI